MNELYQRRLILDALKAGKRYVSKTYLNGGKEQFICLAIDHARLVGETSYEGAKLATKMIEDRIEGMFTLECWLEARVPSYREGKHHVDAVQQYRHRWLDALIREFSK